MTCLNSPPRPLACWVWASRRRRGAPRRRRRRRWAPCWTTRPASFRPARSGPPAPSGAIRYVSDRRPGGAWMLGKPMQVTEARDLNSSGLKIVSCYQYGKGSTSDWLGGAGRRPAARQARHGSCTPRPVVRPAPPSTPRSTTTRRSTSTRQQIVPYLRVLGVGRSATSARAYTPTRKPSTGRCTTAWAPTSGSTTGARRRGMRIPAAHLHQVEIDKRHVGGVGVDINEILKPQFGQWALIFVTDRIASTGKIQQTIVRSFAGGGQSRLQCATATDDPRVASSRTGDRKFLT